jgi:DNA (cytosine-5)-methyltransferase 1
VLRVASLFTGIGGLDAGLEMGLNECGIEVETVAMSEYFVSPKRPHWADDYPRWILAKRYPNAVLHGDVRELSGKDLYEPDILVGGFPCTDISTAKADAEGLAGARSGLWYDQLRLIGDAQPGVAVIENVAALRSRGLWNVLQGLLEAGYIPQYDILSARSVGAPHLRERIFVIAVRQDLWEGPLDLVSAMPSTSSWTSWWPLPWRETKAPKNDKPRIRALGNAVVPQVAAVVGRALGASVLLPPVTWLFTPRGKDAREFPLGPETKLPRAGVAVDGVVLALPEAAPSSRVAARYLLPTPTAQSYGSNQGGAAGRSGKNRASLQTLALQGRLPTPTATDCDGQNVGYRRPDGTRKPSLSRLVRDDLDARLAAGNLPTPTSSAAGHGRAYQQRVRADGHVDVYPTLEGLVRDARVPTPNSRDWKGPVGRGSQANGGHRGSLPTVVHDEHRRELEARIATGDLPTPVAVEVVTSLSRGQGGSLNPEFVEWMQGLPIGWTDVDVD